MSNGTQHKIGKVRPPRVQITYDVETGGVSKEKSLPFVVGVIADVAPGTTSLESKLRDRSFVSLTSGNLNKVMASLSPELKLQVKNHLGGESVSSTVKVTFDKMETFTPAGLVEAVPQLASLMRKRERLNDLLAKLEGNEKLNDLLAEVVLNTDIANKAISESKSKTNLGEE